MWCDLWKGAWPVGLAMLSFGGCDDAPPLNEDVRRRLDAVESEHQKAAEEIARKRAEREGKGEPVEAAPDAVRSGDLPANSGPAKQGAGDSPLEKNAGDKGKSAEGPNSTEKEPTAAAETPPKPPIDIPRAEKAPETPSISRPWADPNKWRQLRGGMRAEDVLQLLGQPTLRANDYYMTYWYYGQGSGAGKVAFTLVSKQAVAWDPPLE